MATRKRAQRTSTTEKHPFRHIGAGVSAARKSWHVTVVLQSPAPRGIVSFVKKRAPAEIDDVSVAGKHTVVLGHASDSLQWVVAARAEGGARSAEGEATDKQWRAFNHDVDALLMAMHEHAPIEVVLRTIDDEFIGLRPMNVCIIRTPTKGCEYGTALSTWHAQSCARLPDRLVWLSRHVDPPTLGIACAMWRAWASSLPGPKQDKAIAALDDETRAIFAEHGGVPEAAVTAPAPAVTAPSLQAYRARWDSLGHSDDAPAVFEAAFGSDSALQSFVVELYKSGDDALAVDVIRRALASKKTRWPDTHWRPDLLDALVRLERFAEADAEVGRVLLAAESYMQGNWEALVRYLDARGRADDANAVFLVARTIVTRFSMKRRGIGTLDRERFTALVLELAAPVWETDLTEDELSSFAFFLEQLEKKGVATAAVLVPANAARERWRAVRAARLARGRAALEAGADVDAPTLKEFLSDLLRRTDATDDEVMRAARGLRA